MKAIIDTPLPRNSQNIEMLDRTAAYIYQEFSHYSPSVMYQPYSADGRTYKNVICSFGPADAPRIIIGAHYDVDGDQPGADDNASGVCGLLELARLLEHSPLKYRIDLVAYSLEEMPYFRTAFMGSYIHARSLQRENTPVKGMISLEMIGFFTSAPHSQHYPLPILQWIYGDTGDFIGLVGKWSGGLFVRQFKRRFKRYARLPVKRISAPPRLQGIDFSDHLNYWQFGFPALMVTDTAFYRNTAYHRPADTIDSIDFDTMAKVIDAVLLSVLYK